MLCCVVLCCVAGLYTAIITVSSSFLRIFANYTTVLSACIIQGVVQRISAYDCTQSNIPRLSFAGDILCLAGEFFSDGFNSVDIYSKSRGI